MASPSLPRQIHDIRACIEIHYYRLLQNSKLLIIHSKIYILALAVYNLCSIKSVVKTVRKNNATIQISYNVRNLNINQNVTGIYVQNVASILLHCVAKIWVPY